MASDGQKGKTSALPEITWQGGTSIGCPSQCSVKVTSTANAAAPIPIRKPNTKDHHGDRSLRIRLVAAASACRPANHARRTSLG